MNYIPHTDAHISKMLTTIDCRTVDDLVPEQVPRAARLNLGEPMSEMDVASYIESLATKNIQTKCFAGGGSYDHYIPSAISHIVLRGEFLTAYTPYQAEASQGMLQALYEYQSYICLLTGMDVSNASLYDGASALAEAVLLAHSHTKRRGVFVDVGLNPAYLQVLRTYCEGADIFISDTINNDVACIIQQTPAFDGSIRDPTHMAEKAHRNGSLFISCISDPTSLAIMRPPGEAGADIVTGEGQSFGIPKNFGGPCLGFMAVKSTLTKKLPGRIVGATQDESGRRGFVLTLQAREQFIRRERATSNITTNQTLLALSATIYLALLGRTGLRSVAHTSYRRAHRLQQMLHTRGFRIMTPGPFYNEFLVETPRPVTDILEHLRQWDILGGVAVDDHRLLVCCTEKNTIPDVETYARGASMQ
ncbi:MAG: aminomethyl-transferring glycine dehydrogenase subunit GcvPA [Cenarchaeum sp. SB0661_bin_35]|nr:aminomethyl-transferring glycine dehydrogenase subunit GcvPA [Cenarchaeum sp. SB0667_bin_13]MYC79259.1 aminomethyl-transferring glycine dehydrogenase subunit GcvPA [Cenarchaeum sp. SB0661_bin_35]MYI51424.1 aminomethyl-transferring glycine dehydrogenase subunit GcvPA [Cenarchaeum sp. SB0673_bin_9]